MIFLQVGQLKFMKIWCGLATGGVENRVAILLLCENSEIDFVIIFILGFKESNPFLKLLSIFHGTLIR